MSEFWIGFTVGITLVPVTVSVILLIKSGLDFIADIFKLLFS